MKIKNLKISGFRGIADVIDLDLNGKNTVIYGPNGTGKSAIVDALDFVFTGKISRLTGKGSQGITLRDHGAHIDKRTSAEVEACLLVDGIDDDLPIKRKVSSASMLEKPEGFEELDIALNVASNGHHILSRAHILRYVAADSSTRSSEVQSLLNIEKIEETRKILGRVKSKSERELSAIESSYDAVKNMIMTKLQLDDFNKEKLLEAINIFREKLKGDKIEEVEPDKYIENITRPESTARVNPKKVKEILEALEKTVQEKAEEVIKIEGEINQLLNKIQEDKELRDSIKTKKLLEFGIDLIEKDECPLCLTELDKDDLTKSIKERLVKAKEYSDIETELHKKIKDSNVVLKEVIENLDELIKISKEIEFDKVGKIASEWIESIGKWMADKDKDILAIDTKASYNNFKVLMKPDEWRDVATEMLSKVEKIGDISVELEAWDNLVWVRDKMKEYFEVKAKAIRAKRIADKAKIISDDFVEVKDNVLKELYDSIVDDFVLYYKHLHSDDEQDFEAELVPEGAKLDFKVDFFGRGKHHPRALHSEGHQDSMGLCLYLALYKKLSQGKLKLIVLDDVVMSIDNNHRRKICSLLNEHFSDFQIIITTHNKTWARQLRKNLGNCNYIEFKKWRVDTGPEYQQVDNIWEVIEKDIEYNDIKGAASKLREHIEFFYGIICEVLKGKVPYKSESRWTAGECLDGALNAIKSYLKKAKKSSNSWNKQEEVEALNEFESIINECIARSKAEQWGINEIVHFNQFEDFTGNDFKPIVEAFQDLERCFICQGCGNLIEARTSNDKVVAISCKCGRFNWNLVEKER